jgi:V8-like Glu-specific endopeptidase
LKISRWIAVVAGVGVSLACSADEDFDSGAASVTFEPIIGGVAATQYPEAAYLNIDMTVSGGYACSGTLIAPRVVLTAGHCVDTHKKWEVYVAGAYRLSTSAAVYDWNEQGAQTVNPAHHDLGLVFLADAVNLSSFPTLSKTKAADGSAALNVGRVLNGVVESAEYQAATTLSAADKVGYPFDYYSSVVIQPGDSGGPVFLKGTHVIAALNSGAGGNTQVLARVDLLSDWLNAQIAAHPVASAAGGAGGAGGTSTGSAGKGGTASAGAGGNGGVNAGSSGKGGAGASAGGTSGASASAAGKGGTASGGASAGSAGSAASICSNEVEPNDTWATAKAAKGSVCANLSTSTDVDFYAVTFAPGTHAIEVVQSTDATLTLGVASGTSCVASLGNVQRANVTVSGATQTLCVKVSSPGKKIQSYQLNAN